MAVVSSFAPIENPNATLLILGSMPGVASLTAQQYYAHPRNAFWPIMAAVYDINLDSCYEERVCALQQTNVAVWDVLQQCERVGSLDSAITKGSQTPNDFKTFFLLHRKINTILFNGAEAEKSFRRTVLPQLATVNYQLLRAPSTSPAYTLPLADKLQRWQSLLSKA